MQALAKSKTITARWPEVSIGVVEETFSRDTIRSNNHSVSPMQPEIRGVRIEEFFDCWKVRTVNMEFLPFLASDLCR